MITIIQKKTLDYLNRLIFYLINVKSKYLLFTQADIIIDQKSILNLKKIFNIDKKIIFVTLKIINKNYNLKNKRKKISFVKNIKAACMVCDVDKAKKNWFF